MTRAPVDLATARILLTNDDGHLSPGLAALERIARAFTDDVWLCAPETEQSASSHSLTIHRPLRLRQLGEKRYAVDGTPTDCVLIALNHLFKDGEKGPDLVFSGINMGANLGDDVTYSGTIAAAMEAALMGVRAIAFSQDIADGAAADFALAEVHGPDIVRRVAEAEWAENVLVNVNFPARDPDALGCIRVVRHGKRKIGDELIERQDPRGRSYFWIGPLRGEAQSAADTDIAVVAAGGIAVTPLCLDLTHRDSLERLQAAFP